MRLSDLAKRIGARCHGDPDLDVISLGTLEEAGPDQITFLGVSTSREMLASCKAGAVILREEDLDGWQGSALVSKNPNSAYALTARALDTTPMPPPGIHQSAVIADSVKVGVDVSIGPNCVIEENAELGDRVIIEPGSVIGANVVIGSETRLFANVTIMHGVKIGQQCFIKSGAVLGSHGFGNTNEDGQWVRIPQLGGLTVGNRVQIGAVTTIDRGAIGDT
ncbi:MAG: UDP-3-O-(3-hydroxymyristoyl)glucosamine N-acyltransferase, partial [Proteobacteria bacterium]|nr:UDP-3-O-(3-hydroxymyristoyl)glucosamine N-acyltransferase [Pseudomonadota bacterium]